MHSLFGTLHSADLEQQVLQGRALASPGLELLQGACSAQAVGALRRVMRGEEGIRDVHSRMAGDLRMFARLGLQLEHTLSGGHGAAAELRVCG